MNNPQQWQRVKAQSKFAPKTLGPLDPRTIAMNRLNNVRPTNAKHKAKSTPIPPLQNVRTNQPPDENHESTLAKPDILQAQSQANPQISTTTPEEVPTAMNGETQRDEATVEENSFEIHHISNTASESPNPPPGEGSPQITLIQRKALSSLLKGISIPDTAELCGVDEWTLREWLDLPEVEKLYRKGYEQNVYFVGATLQEAARKAMATLVRLSECDNQPIATRAAKAIVQLSKPTNAATQKAQVAAEVAKTRLEDSIAELDKVKAALTASAKNWEKIHTSLVHGTFRRPGWLPKESWQRIIRSSYDVSVAW